MEITKEHLDDFKAICDEKGVHYDTDAEYREAARRLLEFFEIMYESALEHRRWDERLKKEPKGFAIESKGRTCGLCYTSVMGEVWYDKRGMKCMTCQNALDKKIIPGYVFKDEDNNRHVTASQLNWKYGVHPQTIRKLVRQKKLKPRVIPNGITLFLRSENPELPHFIEEASQAKETH